VDQVYGKIAGQVAPDGNLVTLLVTAPLLDIVV
jgi:hypothetical protein